MRGFIYDSTRPPVMLRTCCLAQYKTQAPAIEKTVDEKYLQWPEAGFLRIGRYKASSDTSLPLTQLRVQLLLQTIIWTKGNSSVSPAASDKR